MLKLFIKSIKTDQYRDGAWTVVASSRKATCPVAMMNRYLDRSGLSCDSPCYSDLNSSYEPALYSGLCYLACASSIQSVLVYLPSCVCVLHSCVNFPSGR